MATIKQIKLGDVIHDINAVRLDIDTKGSTTQPVYFSEGKPVACTYELKKTVPSDAKFTDTTYSAATTSKEGLMSAADKTKSEATNIAYGTCSTDAATAAKVIAVSNNANWKLAAGSTITILFDETNTADNPTLNVNGTGAKNIFYGSSQITTANLGYAGTASRPMTFMYDGTQYRFIGWGYDSNTTYTNVKLGHGYTTCSTAAATTAKTASLSGYTLVTGGIVAVKFGESVPAGATLNINSKGAKAIYHKGAAIKAGVIKAGDTATFIYSSKYHLISIDRDDNSTYTLSTITGTLAVNKGGTGGTTAANARTNLGFTYGTGLPTEAPSTGDGSVYFFTDELAPITVEEGGTGATNGTEALANLGAADFVIEKGSNGPWYYQKWHSGRMDITYSGYYTFTSGYTIVYISLAHLGVHLVTTDSNKYPVVMASERYIGDKRNSDTVLNCAVIMNGTSDADHDYFTIYGRTAATPIAGSYYIDIVIHGFWK